MNDVLIGQIVDRFMRLYKRSTVTYSVNYMKDVGSFSEVTPRSFVLHSSMISRRDMLSSFAQRYTKITCIDSFRHCSEKHAKEFGMKLISPGRFSDKVNIDSFRDSDLILVLNSELLEEGVLPELITDAVKSKNSFVFCGSLTAYVGSDSEWESAILRPPSGIEVFRFKGSESDWFGDKDWKFKREILCDIECKSGTT